MWEQVSDFLSQPIVGSLIGILGIVIGALLAIVFYIKGKSASKPCYSIENTTLIDLGKGEIPSDVSMYYEGQKIRQLNKTVIQLWNAGKKPIRRVDLSPTYIEIPFDMGKQNDAQIFCVSVGKTREQNNVPGPVIAENGSVRFEFDFLEKGDKISLTIMHSAEQIPSKLEGYVIGVPEGFVNVTERQMAMHDLMYDVILDSYGSFAANLVDVFMKIISRIVR